MAPSSGGAHHAVDEDDALALRLLEGVEVLLGRRRVVVAGDVEIEWGVSHGASKRKMGAE
jgi:hypothetical protein